MRDSLQKDPEATVRAVAKMGYQCVEFYAPYFEWTDAQAKHMRGVLDELGIHCYSTHNDEEFFTGKKIERARDLPPPGLDLPPSLRLPRGNPP